MIGIKQLFKKVKNLIVPLRPNPIAASAPPLTISHTPDTPQSFGYKTAWMAIKTVDTNSVIEALEDLNFSNRQVANWSTGLQAAYHYNGEYLQHEHLFISPPLDGWIFVVGAALDNSYFSNSHSTEGEKEQATQNFVDFAQMFKQHNIPDFYYFCSHRGCSACFWAIIKGGVIKRLFMEFDGDRDEQGEVTLEELQEGYQPALNFDDEVSDEMLETAWYPCEDTVMNLAALWSVRVDDLEALYPKQLGVGIVLTR